jgi:hypothetical protein
LCERYAERLADGRDRERAVGTAAAVAAALVGPPDLDALCRAMAPAVELIDHRVLGFAPVRGVAAMREYLRAMFEAGRFSLHLDDVLGLRPGATLFRETTAGTARSGGGHEERPLLSLWRFGDDGRLLRIEEFDIGREAEAVASFDQLAGVRRHPSVVACTPTQRRRTQRQAPRHWVPPIRGAARLVCRSIGSSIPHRQNYGRAELVESFRRLLEGKGIAVREEMLATLGDSLALSRRLISIDSFGDEGAGSFGAVDLESVILREVDGTGRTNRSELFAVDHLGDAVVRLYERYAELLPEGSDRRRAAVAARAVATFAQQADPDRIATALAPRFTTVSPSQPAPVGRSQRRGFVTHFRLHNDRHELRRALPRRVALTADAMLLRVVRGHRSRRWGVRAPFSSDGLRRRRTRDARRALGARPRGNGALRRLMAAPSPVRRRVPHQRRGGEWIGNRRGIGCRRLNGAARLQADPAGVVTPPAGSTDRPSWWNRFAACSRARASRFGRCWRRSATRWPCPPIDLDPIRSETKCRFLRRRRFRAD